MVQSLIQCQEVKTSNVSTMTKAIHIFSTAPFLKHRPKEQFGVDDFELVCTVLSATMWRAINGPIKLYTDSMGAEFYAAYNLLDVWDEVDADTLNKMPSDIDHEIFWAGAKLFALQHEQAPVAMIDTDLIVWKKLDETLRDSRVTVLHREEFVECYIDKQYLKVRPGYQFNPLWDWNEYPCNTAFAYFADNQFKQHYTENAIDFMKGNFDMPMELISQMVFAEQRLLAMCAKQQKVQIDALIDHPYNPHNEIFTHLWGAKNMARDDYQQRRDLTGALLNKLQEVSPVHFERVQAILNFK